MHFEADGRAHHDQQPTTAKRSWPSQCDVCRQWGESILCASCVDRFGRPGQRCQRCGLRLSTIDGTCGSCLSTPPSHELCICALDYAFPWSELIVKFKFAQQVDLAQALADRLAAAVGHAQPRGVNLIVPMPLSTQRLAQRGYNQAWELAWRLGRALGIAARHDVLMRLMDTPAQVALTKDERWLNLRGAFMVAPGRRQRIAGQHVALVDDVMTTGASVQEASMELLRGGAATVQVWVLARTPAPNA